LWPYITLIGKFVAILQVVTTFLAAQVKAGKMQRLRG
jgi:hypothetical protein